MTKNSGDWEGLQGHDDHPAQFKHKAWVHEGGVADICMYVYGSFRKLGVPYSGVLIIRILLVRVPN